MRENLETAIRTGLTKEYLENGTEKRDPLSEFIEDYEVLGFSIGSLESEVDSYCEKTSIKDDGIFEEIRNIKNKIMELHKRWRQIGGQGELFQGLDDGKGNIISVNQTALEKLKVDFRSWFILASGIKNIDEKTTHDFKSVEKLGESIFSGESDDKKQFYGRGFSESVYEWEKSFSKEIGVGEVVLCNSGMSAIENAIRAEDLKSGDTILVGKEFYYSTNILLKELEERGVRVVEIEMADLNDEMMETRKPKVVFAEGISNNVSMRALNMEEMLKINSRYNENNPERSSRLIIDNTFANPVLLNIGEIAKGYNFSKWTGVESATKYYQQGMDNITAGIVYSSDAEYIQKVKDKRAMVGTNLQDKLVSLLPKPNAEILNRKMLRHSMNALLLSASLEKLGLEINYPSLESHIDNKKTAKEYPKGVGGVFFIKWNNKDGNPQEFLNKVVNEAEKLGVKVKIGVSFGHPETWLETLHYAGNWKEGDERNWEIRIAAGEENVAVIKKVLQAFKNAL